MSAADVQHTALASYDANHDLISELTDSIQVLHEEGAHAGATSITLDAFASKQLEPAPGENLAPKELTQVVSSSQNVKSEVTKDVATNKSRGPMSLTTNTHPVDSNGDPPTPLVKKIINSGTFGTGSVKPTGLKSSVSGSAAATKPTSIVVAPLKKLASSAPVPAATSKPPVTSRTPTTSAPTPNRRASVVPAKFSATGGAGKVSLSSSISKPTPDPAKARASVASPTDSVVSAKGATVRPRASVSEGVKRAALVSKPSATTTSKAPVASKPATIHRPAASSATKSSAPATSSSIMSIQELKEDTKAVEGLQAQLNNLEESLKEKADAITALEGQVEKLQETLQGSLEDIEAKNTLISGLEQTKVVLASRLAVAQQNLADLEEQRASRDQFLQDVQDESESAKAVGRGHAAEVEKFQAQIAELQTSLAFANADLESIHAKHNSALLDATKSADEDHELLIVSQAQCKALSEEVIAIKAAHLKAAGAASGKLAELEAKTGEVSNLTSQIERLRSEKEDTATKVSELEVEVLELKEQVEELDDSREHLKATISLLESEVDESKAVLEQRVKAANLKEAEYESQIQDLKAQHEKDLGAASQRHNDIVGSLESLKAQLSAAVVAQEKSVRDLIAAQEAHDTQVKNLEESHATKQGELNMKIGTITKILESQEALYESKVQVVKAEHEKLLKEAFDQAKREAATTHSEELQALRGESKATIEQIQIANQHSLNAIKGDHASTLETTIKDYTKQLGNLTVELKATQDDLAKSKSTLDTLRADLDTVTKQRDEARALVDASSIVSPEHQADVARLTQELSVTKDDLAAITDMLNLTKSSLAEMSSRHAKDLEEAAQNRVAEVTRLNAAHESEVASLATRKSELLIKLSDLEGELATLKVVSVAEISTPKSNGTVPLLPSLPSVSKEELAKMHEAHNLKIYDLQAEHEKTMKSIRIELEAALEKAVDFQQEIARKAMEIQYLEQEQDETQEHITQLKEDIETLTERCAKEHSAAG